MSRRPAENPLVFIHVKEKPSKLSDITGSRSVTFGFLVGFRVSLEVSGICCLYHPLISGLYYDFSRTLFVIAGVY